MHLPDLPLERRYVLCVIGSRCPLELELLGMRRLTNMSKVVKRTPHPLDLRIYDMNLTLALGGPLLPDQEL